MMKKTLVTFFISVLFFFGSIYAQGLFGPNFNSMMRQGNLSYKKGKFDDALLKYNDVYKTKMNDPLVNYNLGTILYKQGNYDTAAYFFDNAIKYVKSPVLKSKAYYNMGNAYMKNKKYDKAVESYSNSLKYNPNDPDARYNLAYSLRNLKQQRKKQQQQQQQQQQQNNEEEEKKDNRMDQNQANELINSLNNKEQDQNKRMRGQGNNTKSKDW